MKDTDVVDKIFSGGEREFTNSIKGIP